jgi:hypothetical protein
VDEEYGLAEGAGRGVELIVEQVATAAALGVGEDHGRADLGTLARELLLDPVRVVLESGLELVRADRGPADQVDPDEEHALVHEGEILVPDRLGLDRWRSAEELLEVGEVGLPQGPGRSGIRAVVPLVVARHDEAGHGELHHDVGGLSVVGVDARVVLGLDVAHVEEELGWTHQVVVVDLALEEILLAGVGNVAGHGERERLSLGVGRRGPSDDDQCCENCACRCNEGDSQRRATADQHGRGGSWRAASKQGQLCVTSISCEVIFVGCATAPHLAWQASSGSGVFRLR